MDLAQMAGWFAAGAAIIAMLQKSDLRLKQGLIIHTVRYGIHFALLGLPTAVISCVIALACSAPPFSSSSALRQRWQFRVPQ